MQSTRAQCYSFSDLFRDTDALQRSGATKDRGSWAAWTEDAWPWLRPRQECLDLTFSLHSLTCPMRHAATLSFVLCAAHPPAFLVAART
eukprot:15282694-Alexandrium_andersonii.AAC.1